MLDVDTATAYLIARGLIAGNAVVDGELTITSVPRRNRNLRVRGPVGRNYLIKQPEDRSGTTLHCEASFYTFCHEHLAGTDIRDILPHLVAFDRDAPALVLDWIGDGVPLWVHYHDHADFPRDALRRLGRALGLVHSRFRSGEQVTDSRLHWLPRGPPPLLRVHRPGLDWLATLSAPGHEVLRIVQRQRAWLRYLDRLAGLWTPETIIHGDVRSDNVLVVSTLPQAGPTGIRLVDWELVQHGDPAWDVAAALRDLVAFWVSTLPLPSRAAAKETSEAIAQAPYSWPVIQSAFRAFWQAYREAAALEPGRASPLLLRAVQFSSAHLIQAALEATQGARHLSSYAVLLLQTAANLAKDAASSQVRFYGIPQASGP